MSRFPHKFPKGYKQFKIMERMVAHNGLTYTELIKFAFELTNGSGSFDPVNNRGYWSGAFVYKTPGFYGANVNGWITKYCEKHEDGKYRVSDYEKYESLKNWKVKKEKFAELSPKKAAEIHKEKHSEKNPWAEDFKKRYAEPLANFEARQVAKRVPCSNGMVNETGDVFIISPEVPLRGFKLDDEVIYYRKRNGETGVGYIQSIKETSEKIAGHRFEISIGINNATIPQISYDETSDGFFEMGGFEIQLVKKIL